MKIEEDKEKEIKVMHGGTMDCNVSYPVPSDTIVQMFLFFVLSVIVIGDEDEIWRLRSGEMYDSL